MKLNIPIIIVSSLLSIFMHSTFGAEDDIKLPFRFAKGKMLFDQNCASCHGPSLKGTTLGPPLVHIFYKPDHHGDQAFYSAAIKGVKAHHWKFGDMPAVAEMTATKMDRILPYIRFYQQQKKLY